MINKKPKIAFLTNECNGYFKIGGLGDYCNEYIRTIDTSKYDIAMFMYLTPAAKPKQLISINKIQYLTNFQMEFNNENIDIVILKDYITSKIPIYFLLCKPFMVPNASNLNYIFLQKAIVKSFIKLNFIPDIIHSNDWFSGGIKMYLNKYNLKSKILLVCHSFAKQFISYVNNIHTNNEEIIEFLDIYSKDDKLNFLQASLQDADKIIIVSKTYKDEFLLTNKNKYIEYFLKTKNTYGILNGVDYSIYESYSTTKEEFQNKYGLEIDKNQFMVCFCGRLSEQKGIILIIEMLEKFYKGEFQLIFITDFYRYELNAKPYLDEIEKKYPKSFRQIQFSNSVEREAYSVCDAMIMPSLFETCGLAQMKAMYYGCVPLATNVGGLSESIKSFPEFREKSTGFLFNNYTAQEFYKLILTAKDIFFNAKTFWNIMVNNCKLENFSWKKQIQEYYKIYDFLLNDE